MKKLLLLFVLAISFNVNAQTTNVLIPDANFAAYLQTLVPTAMTGDSLNTSSTLVTTSTHTISINSKGIASLSGVQYFTSLKYLSFSGNLVTSLPTLPNTLTELFCDTNQLTSLPALPASLQVLQCNNNYLTTLPALPNSLYFFNCDNNSIDSLPAFLPNSLIYFWVDNTNLTHLANLVT